MKIGLVLSKTPGYSETFFISKIRGLQAQGYEVVLFVQSSSNDFNLCEVRKAFPVYRRNILMQIVWFIFVFAKLSFNLKAVIKFLKLERETGTGIRLVFKKIYHNAHLLTHKMNWLHFGFATMALGKEHVAESIGAKMAVSLRGFDIAIYPVKHPNCYELLWKKVDKVHVISHDLYHLAIKNGLKETTPFQRITPAIDTTFFSKKAKKNSQEAISILTVGRLHWKKGFLDTIKALKLLREKNINFRYTIVGDGEEFEALTYVIHSLNLNEQVKLVGKKSKDQIKYLYEMHNIYIQYSISEGFCNAVLEAQAMGLLCIVSDAEGLPENVLDQQTGWVVPKRSPEKLAECIEDVIKLPESQKNEVINRAVNRVKKDFNLEQQQKDFVKFYR